MRHPRSFFLPIVVVALFAAACGSPSTSSEGNAQSEAPDQSEAGQASDEPGATAAANPPIADGQFTGGSLQASVSGAATLDLDLDLIGGTTAGGATSLTYGSAEGGAFGVFLSDQGNAITFTTTELTTAGGTQEMGAECAIVVTSSDASGVAGTIDCRSLPAILSNSTSGEVDIEGTFEASR